MLSNVCAHTDRNENSIDVLKSREPVPELKESREAVLYESHDQAVGMINKPFRVSSLLTIGRYFEEVLTNKSEQIKGQNDREIGELKPLAVPRYKGVILWWTSMKMTIIRG